MLNYDMDPRDGTVAGGSCNECCCHEMQLRPGETNLVQLNYAPWSLGIAPPGIVAGTEYAIQVDSAACPDNSIESFPNPVNTNYEFTTATGQSVTIDLSANAAPVANTFSYAPVPLQGPSSGMLTPVGAGGGSEFIYMPRAGFAGHDYFTYRMVDGQGREVIRTVHINVGSHYQPQERQRMAMNPFIDVSKIDIDSRYQTVRFPIYMPLSVQECQTFRMTVKQPARDCSGTLYEHFSCFNITSGECP